MLDAQEAARPSEVIQVGFHKRGGGGDGRPRECADKQCCKFGRPRQPGKPPNRALAATMRACGTAWMSLIELQYVSPHLRQYLGWAHPSHICAGTGLTPPTSAPGLGAPLPRLRRDRWHEVELVCERVYSGWCRRGRRDLHGSTTPASPQASSRNSAPCLGCKTCVRPLRHGVVGPACMRDAARSCICSASCH